MIVRTRFVVEFSRKLIKVSFLVSHKLIQFSKTFHRSWVVFINIKFGCYLFVRSILLIKLLYYIKQSN